MGLCLPVRVPDVGKHCIHLRHDPRVRRPGPRAVSCVFACLLGDDRVWGRPTWQCLYGGGSFTTSDGTITIPGAYANSNICYYTITTVMASPA